MTQSELNTLALQLERVVEILRSDATAAEKINTLERIGGICSYVAKKWGEEEFNKMVDNLDS